MKQSIIHWEMVVLFACSNNNHAENFNFHQSYKYEYYKMRFKESKYNSLFGKCFFLNPLKVSSPTLYFCSFELTIVKVILTYNLILVWKIITYLSLPYLLQYLLNYRGNKQNFVKKIVFQKLPTKELILFFKEYKHL